MISVILLSAAFLSAPSGRGVDFDSEIIPVLTKAGCNAGSCHGAAAGRGGFRLSLLGGDPAADYESIVHDLEGRRINLAKPAASLLIAKPTGMLSHEGEAPLSELAGGAERLIAWISAGAPRGKSRKLTHFDVRTQVNLVHQLGSKVPLRSLARFDGGDVEDVTAWTVFTSTDSSAVELNDEQNLATVRRRGQHILVARFLDRVVPLQLTMPLSDLPVDLSGEPRTNFIDDEVFKKLERLCIPLAGPADDSAFLRRVYLDLTGSLPKRELVDSFLNDPQPNKRARLVDQLLQSEAFADYWALKFAKLLHIHSLPNDAVGARSYYQWLRQQIANGTPWDKVAHQLLTATGDSHVIGPANFARMVGDARGHAELVSQAFLGVRLQCANCHNHPLDRWTQDDYHGLAAIFSRLDRGREVQVTTRGAVTNLRTGEPAIPRIPGSQYLDPQIDGREQFSNWITAHDNRYFARSMVNRLWQAMFGRGLIDPVDDLRDTNPATHPELLEMLAADFIKHDFQIRHTLRQIALSQTSGRSGDTITAPSADDCFYSHAYRRPLDPEVIADAVSDVTGVGDQYGDKQMTRAVFVYDPLIPAPSLDILGRCSRAAGCEGMSAGGGLASKLHLLNGELINRKVTDPAGRLHQLLAGGKSNSEIVADFYLRGLSRPPTAEELEFCERRLAAADSDRTACSEDFVWSLLNCQEFNSNH